ncbi:MAG: type I-E CRISPR-associated protein Cse2/CasB [Chloroflexi bacterium]|nr:type I-E CRISPR-associated protein Cse2/CasB [Chloroflexota bacterium]
MTAPAPPARQHPLIARLVQLKERDDRAALAALRRGLGKPPGTVPEMFPYVEPFIPVADYAGHVDAAYLVASLFGLHPTHGEPSPEARSRQQRGFGASLARIRLREGTTDDDEGVARRFGALLNCDREGLPTHLRHLMTLLRSRAPEAPIDYGQLYNDIVRWDDADRHVQRNWAAGFWRRASAPTDTAEPNDDTTTTTPDPED